MLVVVDYKPGTRSVSLLRIILIAAGLGLLSCSIIKTTYTITAGTLKLGYTVTKFAGKTVYHVGKFTFTVVAAPLSWPLIRDDIEIIVRVNDRGPFIEGRIIDLSAGASQKLGFYDKGTARVLVEAVQLEGG
ncbi:MAG: septal ring lytic transglycosylase RlpA family protein [Desulfobacterales bacterium]|nr:septal ring lytic transglycosylase RlpA family protein [Desulfobacterales bacterium]